MPRCCVGIAPASANYADHPITTARLEGGHVAIGLIRKRARGLLDIHWCTLKIRQSATPESPFGLYALTSVDYRDATKDVDLESLTHFDCRRIQSRSIRKHAGIVHQNIQATVVALYRLRRRRNAGGVSYLELHGYH